MIFESILLDKVQEEINYAIKDKINYDSNDPKYAKEVEKLTSKITFDWFKVINSINK